MSPGFLRPLVRSSGDPLVLRNTRNGLVVAERLEAAFDSDTRRRGLMGRQGLAPGSALVIAPSNSVHTFFMKFPIDIVFAARDGRVLKVRPGVGPWRLSGALRGFAVIELPSGSAEMADLRAGDVLELVAP